VTYIVDKSKPLATPRLIGLVEGRTRQNLSRINQKGPSLTLFEHAFRFRTYGRTWSCA
jgi:hypothetical protein